MSALPGRRSLEKPRSPGRGFLLWKDGQRLGFERMRERESCPPGGFARARLEPDNLLTRDAGNLGEVCLREPERKPTEAQWSRLPPVRRR